MRPSPGSKNKVLSSILLYCLQGKKRNTVAICLECFIHLAIAFELSHSSKGNRHSYSGHYTACDRNTGNVATHL